MIKVENLVYQYPDTDSPTLLGLDFEIKKGEIFGFLGPSGSGKSTAQKVLYKTLSGFEGKAEIEGKSLADWDNTYFNKIGVGFELPNHYLKLTGKENLELFATFYDNNKIKSVEELFEMVDMSDAINKPVEAYSKGMKMRLNFIRAVQHNPDILFFDEPTSGLDPVNAQKIKKHILGLKKEGKTIFITTHSMHTADELCDRVAFLVEGKIRATDTPENFKDKYGKDAVLVETQTGIKEEFSIKGLGTNGAFLKLIETEEVKHIHTLEASLEEVFIQVTGKTLS